MLARAHLDLLMRSFKVEASAYLKEARVSSGMSARRTSDAIGKLTRSGVLHLGFTPHTVLSRTRRGSFPSACTTLSLPIATPLCQCCLACSMDISVRTTHPLEISFSKRADTVAGSASAAFQFPMRSELVRQVCVLFGRPLHATWQLGEGSAEFDVWVIRCGCQCMQKRQPVRLASVGSQASGAGMRTASTSSDSWTDRGGSGLSDLTWARILGINFCAAHCVQACATIPSGWSLGHRMPAPP